MFVKAGPQYVVDKENGISLEATGPYSFLYRNKDRSATLSSEPLLDDTGVYSVCFYLSDLQEWDEPQGAPLADTDRETIKNDVVNALALLDVEVEVE